MSNPFQDAWMLLKNIRGGPTGRRMPMTEEESYGDISHRENPMHGLEDDDDSMDRYEEQSMPPGRRMGGTPPLNIGRAGSTDIGEETMSAMDEVSPEDITAFQDHNYRQRGPPNPFPKPLEGRVQDQLAEFADGAGRRAAMSPQPNFSGAKEDDEMDGKLTPFVGEAPKELSESHPEAYNIASNNIRGSPRQNKRGQMDSGQAFKRPGFRGPAMPLPGGKEDGDFQNMPPQFHQR